MLELACYTLSKPIPGGGGGGGGGGVRRGAVTVNK